MRCSGPKRHPWLLAAFVAVLLVAPFPPVAPARGADETSPAPAAAVYPGLAEVVPHSTQVDTDASRVNAALLEIRGPEAFAPQYDSLLKDWRSFRQRVADFGPREEWPVNRLLDVRGHLDAQLRSLGHLLDQIAAPLRTIEEIRQEWEERLEYWEGWQRFLDRSGARAPRQTFDKVRDTITGILGLCKKRSTELLLLQEKVSRLHEDVVRAQDELDVAVNSLRRDVFKRNAHPLLSGDFFSRFDRSLLERAVEGASEAFLVDREFFHRQGWLLVLQVLLVAGLIVQFRRLEVLTAEKTDDWQFIFRRPVSAALFVALAAPRLFYAVPPPALLQLFIIIVATICAARLASELLREGNQRTLIYVLAGLFIVSKTLTILALPPPLYRVYLVVVALTGIPFLFRIARRHRRHLGEGTDRYLLVLHSGKLLLAVVLLTQLGGYAALSLRLIEATVDTVFLALFALMALRIAEGAIDLVFHYRPVRESRLVANLGVVAIARFTRLIRVLIGVVTLLYLLEIWGVFDSIGVAWFELMALEYSIGEFHISVKMVSLVVAVMYVASLFSWFFQAFLEAQVFSGKEIDRGVRDAFKKLGHYSLVLIGFIIAMTMAGIELQNFAILAGAFGIGIGFGLQDIVNNFVSGLILLFERPVKVGDAVIIDGQWGAITKIGMRSTVVETWDRSELIVPNSQMISEKVLNWTLSSNVSRVTVKVGVKYGSDLEKVVDILNRVGVGHPAVVGDPPPSAIFTEFGDSSINFELRVWVDDIKNRLKLISDLGIEIDRQFRMAGIEIPFPQRDLHLKSVAPEIDLGGK